MTLPQYDGAALNVDITENGVIFVAGEIDMAGGPILDAALVEREADDPLVVDLEGVSFIDSSGLRSLLGASQRAQGRGTSIVLRSAGPEVMRLLDITGTGSMFVLEHPRA